MIKEKYMHMKMLEEQIEKVQEQVQSFDKQAQELENIKEGLEGSKSLKEDTEMLVPLSPGIFMKAKVGDTKQLIVNVGSHTAVTRTADEATAMVDEQIKGIGQLKEQFTTQLNEMVEKGQEMEAEVRILVEKHMK